MVDTNDILLWLNREIFLFCNHDIDFSGLQQGIAFIESDLEDVGNTNDIIYKHIVYVINAISEFEHTPTVAQIHNIQHIANTKYPIAKRGKKVTHNVT